MCCNAPLAGTMRERRRGIFFCEGTSDVLAQPRAGIGKSSDRPVSVASGHIAKEQVEGSQVFIQSSDATQGLCAFPVPGPGRATRIKFPWG